MMRINRNEPLCDGTPRFERGYRAYVDGPRNLSNGRHTAYRSPLMASEADARAWAEAKKVEAFQDASGEQIAAA